MIFLQNQTRRAFVRLGCFSLIFALCQGFPLQAAESWQAGLGRVVITPEGPIWMSGYASRTAPSEGKIHDLFARAAVLRDPQGTTAVFVSMDVIGVPASMAKFIGDKVLEKHKVPRANIMLTCSHTHCGPSLDDRLKSMLFLSPEEYAKVAKYQDSLNQKVLEVIDAAFGDLKPAQLSTGIGKAEFASHRRAPIGTGPIDHEVPVLCIRDQAGEQLRGLIFGYACHNTTLGFQKLCGDYAGFAQLELEAKHPGVTALFHLGCGGDQNPLPRRTLERAQNYGHLLAAAVDEAVELGLTPVTGKLECRYQLVDLPLAHIPSAEELRMRAKLPSKYEQGLANHFLEKLSKGEAIAPAYPFPVQIWKLGDKVTWVALGGEITVEYSLRIKEKLGYGKTWVTGYANDVMAYIPSEKILGEGGYEGDTSMVYYLMPSKWAPGIEQRILSTTFELAR